MALFSSCAIVVAGSQRNQKTVNIVTTKVGTFKQYAQIPVASAHDLVPTFQASAGGVVGIKTICIPGYAGPA